MHTFGDEPPAQSHKEKLDSMTAVPMQGLQHADSPDGYEDEGSKSPEGMASPDGMESPEGMESRDGYLSRDASYRSTPISFRRRG